MRESNGEGGRDAGGLQGWNNVIRSDRKRYRLVGDGTRAGQELLFVFDK